MDSTFYNISYVWMKNRNSFLNNHKPNNILMKLRQMTKWLWIDENMKEGCGLLWRIIQAGTPTDTTHARKKHPGRNSNWATPRHNKQNLINLFGHLLLIWWKNQHPRPQYYNYKSLYNKTFLFPVHTYTRSGKTKIQNFSPSTNRPKIYWNGSLIYINIQDFRFPWWVPHIYIYRTLGSNGS